MYETRVPVFNHGMKTLERDERRGEAVYLFQMFLDHDRPHGTSVSYDFSNLWANRRVTFLFTIVGLIIQIVI